MALLKKIRVGLLASEWRSKSDELSTFTRELAIRLAKLRDVQVSVLLPQCDWNEKHAALTNNVTLVQATRRPGFDDLCCPPKDLQVDFVIGHGVELGHQARGIQELHGCKWVQVVHTAPEELGMLKDCSGAISKEEKNRQHELDLCVSADFVVAVGSEVAEAYQSYLRLCKKDQKVFVLTPGIFSDFSGIPQSNPDGSKWRVLLFGHGDAEDFSLKGLDIAAKAVAKSNDADLVFVGAKKQDEIAGRLKEYKILPSRLIVRSFTEARERLEEQFSEVDLAIMPSRTEGFGLIALEALSAGLPVLVSGNSRFGRAMREVAFGSQYVIDSEDAEVWAAEIEKVRTKRREIRQQELEVVRYSYAKKYNWEEQCRDLVKKMRCLLNGANEEGASLSKKELPSISGSRPDLGNLLRLVRTTHDLSDERQEMVEEILGQQAQLYKKYHNISTAEGESAFIEYIKRAYDLARVSVSTG